MIPGEILPASGKLTLNAGRPTIVVHVENTGDRPVQVGSHYHFYEVNEGLRFDREKARGMRLDIAAGTAVRFEPGSGRDVTLIAYAGARRVFGFNAKVSGDLEPKATKKPAPKKKPAAAKQKPAPKATRPKKAAKPKSKARARRR